MIPGCNPGSNAMGSFIRRKTKCLLSYISESTAPYIRFTLLKCVHTHILTIRKMGRFLFLNIKTSTRRGMGNETLSKNLESVQWHWGNM